MPPNANKYYALELLLTNNFFEPQNVVYAGDSGNDIPILISNINAILVANAHPTVKDEVIRRSQQLGNEKKLYLAQGAGREADGNYSNGVMEGILHYLPPAQHWL